MASLKSSVKSQNFVVPKYLFKIVSKKIEQNLSIRFYSKNTLDIKLVHISPRKILTEILYFWRDTILLGRSLKYAHSRARQKLGKKIFLKEMDHHKN